MQRVEAKEQTVTKGSAAGRIVVGVDGSELSLAALRWAADEACRRDVGLHVVTCWSFPMLPWGPYLSELSGSEFDREARTIADNAIDQVLGRNYGDLDVTVESLDGPASVRLLEFELIAEMIVVGSRGRGGFTGLLLGSVSQHLAEHARCPVVIIPAFASDE